MKLADIPNIIEVAIDFFQFRANRDYWQGATTLEGRECYRFWDDRMTIIASTVATISGEDVQTVRDFLTDTGRANSTKKSAKSA